MRFKFLMKSRGCGSDCFQKKRYNAKLSYIEQHLGFTKAIPRVKNLYVSHGKRQVVYTRYISTIEIPYTIFILYTVSLIPDTACPHCGEMQSIVNLH